MTTYDDDSVLRWERPGLALVEQLSRKAPAPPWAAEEVSIRHKFAEAWRTSGPGLPFDEQRMESTRVYGRGPVHFELSYYLAERPGPEDVAALVRIADGFDWAVVAILVGRTMAAEVLHLNAAALIKRKMHPGYAGGAPSKHVPDAIVPPGYP